MSDNKYLQGRGLDLGTSFIISSRQYTEGEKVMYTEFRDAFLRLKPTSPISKKMMAKGLKGQQYFEDVDGSYIIVGQDAIERAIERNSSVSRPLVRGIISPKEKQARRILRHILKEILGSPLVENEKVVYSVPAQPVDQSSEDFDVCFHADVIGNDIKALGFNSSPLNEAEAVCYSELENDDYSGISCSCGAGMINVCLMSSGEGILHYSTSKSGDFIDKMAAQATGNPETVIQVEKEGSKFTIGQEIPSSPILSAVSLYYVRLIDYTVQHLIEQITSAESLPKFTSPIPIVIAGGTSLAQGFIQKFKEILDGYTKELPFQIKEVRAASNPLRSVARGCLLASHL